MFMIAILALLIALVALLLLLLLRAPPPPPQDPPPQDPPPNDLPDPSLPLPTRHVSFSLTSSNTSYSFPTSPSVSLPSHRRWSSPFHRRKSTASDSPCPPQPYTAQNSPVLVDQFGRFPPSSSRSASFDTHPSPKSPKRLFTPPRFSLPNRWRSSSVSSTSTPVPLDQVDTRPPSPPPSTSTPSPPLQRTRFVNPFKKHSRSRTLSPPSTPDTSSSPSIMPSPSPPPQGRRSLVNKFKTVFKSMSPEPSPIILSKPIVKTVNTRLRRKPVARTQPYGPPWNAPMPVPDFTLSQHSFQKHAEPMSPFPQTSRKCFVHESPLPQTTLMLPGQISPCTFIHELDEKLSLLQQQRIQDLVPSSLDHEIATTYSSI